MIEIGQENDNTSEEFTIPQILESFKWFDRVYKREQIDAAIKLKDEITPHLLNILENVLADPEKYAENPDRHDYIYAVMLLGHFKETKAHQVVVDLFSLPGDLTEKLFGEIKTAYLAGILLNTCGGSLDLIKSMILDRNANAFCRISACDAMAYAVLLGYVSRTSVIAFFGTLFTGKEADKMSDFWGLLAAIIHNLYPKELMGIIKQAYDDNLIAPGLIHYSEFETTLEMGQEKCLETLKNDMERDCWDDIHAVMSSWVCFNPSRRKPSLPIPLNTDDHTPVYSRPLSSQPIKCKKKDKKKDKKKKLKRKQIRASKKKNRR